MNCTLLYKLKALKKPAKLGVSAMHTTKKRKYVINQKIPYQLLFRSFKLYLTINKDEKLWLSLSLCAIQIVLEQ